MKHNLPPYRKQRWLPKLLLTFMLASAMLNNITPGLAQTASSSLACGNVLVTATSTTICLGDSVTLFAQQNNPSNSSFTWSATTGILPAYLLASGYYYTSIRVGPTQTTTYTVTPNFCGRPGSITIKVNTNCCEAGMLSKPPIKVVPGSYSAASSPFRTPGSVYKVDGDIYLSGGTFTISNMKVLMAPNANIYLEQDADLLLVENAVITAECNEMWGGIYVSPKSRGIRSSNGPYIVGINTFGGMTYQVSRYSNNSLLHSRYGVVIDYHYKQYLRLRGLDFQHCMQGITFDCTGGPAQATDLVLGCTFDSDPQLMKKPFEFQSTFDQFYSEAALNLSGDVSQARIAKNVVNHSLFGVRLDQQVGAQVVLKKNTFRDCYLAGIYADNPNGGAGGVKVDTCQFMYPNYLPFTNQTLGYVYPNPVLALVPANYETFGLLAMKTPVEATGNRFEWNASDSTYATDYSILYSGSPRGYGDRTGIYGDQMNSAIGNYFRLLHAGISIPTGSPTLEGNTTLNCERGIELGNRDGSAAGVTVTNSCNTFARFDGGRRTGKTFGFYALPNTSVALRQNSSGTGPIKNLFTTGGVAVAGTHHSIYNDPGNGGINYEAFPNSLLYGNFTDDVRNASVGSVTVNASSTAYVPGSSGNGCATDGYPNAGIQRPALSVGHLVGRGSMKPAAPNPVVDETLIGYVLPSGTQHAELLVRSGLSGKVVHTATLDAKTTESRLSVRDLPAGLYFCTLVADGMPVQTQRLLVTH